MNEQTTQDSGRRGGPRGWPVWLMLATLLGVAALVTVVGLLWPDVLHLDRAPASDWPTAGWARSTPAEEEMDADKLAALSAYIDEQEIAVDGMVVVRHGRIVFEEYGPGYGPRTPHILHSVTKSVTSMLVGIAIDRGYLEGVEVSLAELFPGRTWANPDPRKDRITLENLLEMTDGLGWSEHDLPYDDPANPVHQMLRSADPIQFVLDRPMAHEPGEAWAYNSGASVLLGAAVEEATGQDLAVFAREVLFDPLGIGTTYWERLPDGHYNTQGGLNMAPRDMARLGYLMLHDGRCDGQQIVSARWVARSTSVQFEAQRPYGYGYQWWVLPDGEGFQAQGLYDQHIYVLPEADLVIAVTADLRGGTLHHVEGLVNSFIRPACTDVPVRASRAVYDAHGFTLDYPAGFSLEEAPIPGHAAVTDRSGIVQITSNTEPLEVTLLLWNELEGGEEAGGILELYLAGLGREGMAIVPGEEREGRKGEHALAIRLADLTLEGGTVPSVSAAWICEASGRGFAVTYLTAAPATPDDLVTALEETLARLACH